MGFDEELAKINEVIERTPNYAAAYFNRGVLFLNSGQNDEAISNFSKSIELEPNQVAFYRARGIVYDKQGKTGLALEDYKAALKLQPDNTELQQFVDFNSKFAQACMNEAKEQAKIMGYTFGIKLEEITDIDKIIAEYTQNPNRDSAKEILAQAYYIRGLMFESQWENAQAIEAYGEAIKNEPDYVFALKNRGRINLNMGNYDQAIADLKKANQINPDNASVRELLDMAKAQM